MEKVIKEIWNIPFYRNIILTSDFDYKDFQNIPLLDKDIIRNNNCELINKSFTQLSHVYKNTSGGSTGEPVTIWRTKQQSLHGSINYLLSMHLNGANIYDFSVDLWGAERDMHSSVNSTTKILYLIKLPLIVLF